MAPGLAQRVVLAFCAAAFCSATLGAAAQDLPSSEGAARTPGPRDEGRALFEDGMADEARGDYAAARVKLARALEFLPHPSVAYNLALLHQRTGDALASLALLNALLEGTYGELPAGREAEARTLRAEVGGVVATLRVVVQGPERADLRIDGARVDEVVEGRVQPYRVNPGERRVLASSPDYESAERVVTLDPGGSERVVLSLTRRLRASMTPTVVPGDSVGEEQSRDEASGRRRRQILGVSIGVALLVAGGVVAFLVLRNPDSPSLGGVSVVDW